VSDFQRKKLVDAEERVWRAAEGVPDLNSILSDDRVVHISDEVCSALGERLVRVELDDDAQHLSYWHADARLILPPWARRPLPVLHALTHHVVNPIFPEHGAEYARQLLVVLERFGSPDLAARMRAEFDAMQVHYDPAVRARRVRRSAVFAANNERGVLAELILDDPPEAILGPVQEVRGGILIIGDREVELDRARYITFER
jgi:hypothetical protein